MKGALNWLLVRNHRVWTLGILLALTVFILFRYNPSPTASPPPSDDGVSPLWIDPRDLDFGLVWEDYEFRWIIPIENRGSEPFVIEEFWSSCNCSSVAPRSLTIPPGEKREIRLTLNLTSLDKHGASNGGGMRASFA